MVVNRSAHDCFDGKRTDLDFDRDWNAIDVCAHVRAVRPEWTLQCRILHLGQFLKGLENLHLAAAVRVALVVGVEAGNRIDVCEVTNRSPAGFQDHFFMTIKADEWAVRLVRKVRLDGLIIDFPLGAKHGVNFTMAGRQNA